MRIGELASKVGVNPKTIRFYEEKSLLPEPVRLSSGYRDYDFNDESRLIFIKTAQRLGFSLAEIAEILALKERGERPCDFVLGVLNAHVAQIDRSLGELVALRAELLTLKARGDELRPEDSYCCTLIEHVKATSE
jgi:DNA-binding transcriptional MerR regulator